MHVLLLQSGGTRGADTAGFIIGAGLAARMFGGGIVANSSGAANGAFLATGQYDLFEPCWTKTMPSPRFVSRRNLFYGRPMLDMRYVRREVFSRLDSERLAASSSLVLVGVMRLKDGSEAYLRLDAGNAVDLLCASCSLPFVTPAVSLLYNGNPEPMKDGAIAAPLPIQKALELATMTGGKVLVVMTRPMGGRLNGYSRAELLAARWLYPRAYQAFTNRVSRYDAALRLAEAYAGQVMICYPDEEPEGGRFHTDPVMAKRNFDRGLARGRAMAARVAAFLGC